MQRAFTARAQIEERLVDPVLLRRFLHQRFMVGRGLLEALELLGAHGRRQDLLELIDGALDVTSPALRQGGMLDGRDLGPAGGPEARDVLVQDRCEPASLVREQPFVVGRLHAIPPLREAALGLRTLVLRVTGAKARAKAFSCRRLTTTTAGA